jgi:RNA polymerase sigma-70 factor (ECF subfamily)
MKDGYGRLYEEIDREFRPRVSRYLARLVGQAEAEDVAQDTMVRINRGLATFKGDSSLATWIYRIATNAAFDYQKSASFRRNSSCESIGGGHFQEPQSKYRSPDEVVTEEEMRTCIRRFLNALTEKNRVALILSEFEMLSSREIAGILGISYESAKMRVFRSRSAFRKLLSHRCHLYRDTDFNLACEPFR